MSLDYLQYCRMILLNEENQKEVFERLHKVFPEEVDFSIYSSILNLFPSLNAKSIIASVLIRTKQEREKTNIGPTPAKEVFLQLIELLKRNVKVDLAAMLKKDRTDHPLEEDSQLFTHFTELVHQNIAKILAVDQRRLQKKSAVHITKSDDEETLHTKYPNPVYVDDNVEIYQAKSPGECAAYEKNSSICLRHPIHFWGSYRIPFESSFYFIFPKSPRETFSDPRATDPQTGMRGGGMHHRFLMIEVRKDRQGVWTWEDNVMHNFTDLDSIKTLFPFIITAIEKGIFKQHPLTSRERESYRLVQDEVDDQTFLNFHPELKDMYIANQHDLTDRQWNMLSREQKHDYINFSMNRDLTDYQYEEVKKNIPEIRRYNAIKKRSLEEKIKSGEFTKSGITKHEAAVLPNLLSNLNDAQKTLISTSLVKTMKEILTGRIQPKNDISGIYNLFKGQLLSDPSMQSDDILMSIADILGGGKTVAWKQLPAAVKDSVYSVATDLYKANPRKMRDLINRKIESDFGVLLQGLIDVPTDFQAEYFQKHKPQLLGNEEFRSGLDQVLKSHLVYGSDLPTWLKNYWNADKFKYINNPEFMTQMKTDFQNMLYGKDGAKYPPYTNFPKETKELYDILIDEIRADPTSKPIVEQTLYDLVLHKSADLDNVDNWEISNEYKKYFKEHEDDLKSWITYKVIDTPPDHNPPQLVKTIEKYKNIVLNDPNYKKLIEERLIGDIISNIGISFGWSGTRIEYWMQHFWDILSRFPNTEKQLVERIKKEYGTDRTANAFYTEYGIPLSFYQKHEKEILNDDEAFRGLKQKIIDLLQWRSNKNATTKQAVETELSPIEKDFYLKHKNEFPENKVSVASRGVD